MIEELKELQLDDIIIFKNNQVIDLIEEEEMAVTGVKNYFSDDTEMVIIELEGFHLVAHNFETEEKLFIYQLIGEGDTANLEDVGYKFLNEDDDFRHKIVIRENGRPYIYHPSDTGAIYGLSRHVDEGDEPQEVSICEFFSAAARLSSILIEREDDNAYILQGFEINEEDFEIETSE